MSPLIAISLLLLSGCRGTASNTTTSDAVANDTESTDTVDYQDVFSVESTEVREVRDTQIQFKPGDTMPLMTNGEAVGSLYVNWVQRLGIWDFNNATACAVGSKSSYTINLHVDFTDTITDGETKCLTIEGYLVNGKGEKVGSPCCVGWSGFPQVAQLYDRTKEVDVEVGIQPEILDETGCGIRLEVKDNDGNVYDPIMLSALFLAGAEQGVSIADTQRTVHCINGAAFTINVDEVSINEVWGDNYDELLARYYDVDYRIVYDMAPGNDREDLQFDSNNGNALKTKLIMGVQADVDAVYTYEGDENAVRQLYADNLDEFGVYTTTTFPNLAVGASEVYTVNRKIPDTTGTPGYVRIQFEFPEEAKVRSLEEMKSFDGRFCIIQQEITERELPNTPVEEEGAEWSTGTQ